MTPTVGLFGKLPAHADFVRRGLPSAVVTRLDDWLQTGFSRAADPAAAIVGLESVRLASSAVVAGAVALGAIATSSDQVGRRYVVVALGLWPNPADLLPAVVPAPWDDWCARVEALLAAAQSVPWNADATQAALEAVARATAAPLVAAPPFGVPDDLGPATMTWHTAVGGGVARCPGLPTGDAFDRMIALCESRP